MSQSLETHYSLLLGMNPPWKVANVDLALEESRVIIHVEHSGKRVKCPHCDSTCSVKDYAPERQWRHLDTMNFETIVKARIPRCGCKSCGAKTLSVPWAEKHSRFTLMFEAFAVKVLQASKSIEAGRQLIKLSWDGAQSIMKRAVDRGLERRDTSEVELLGIDEKSFLKGHSYLTALNDLKEKRVLDVVEERTEKACYKLFEKVLPSYYSRFKIEAIAMDMWPPFRKVSLELLENATLIYDRFHISQYLNNAVDQVRRAEHKQLLKNGDRSLVGTRYSLVRSKKTRTEKNEEILGRISKKNLKTSRAWAIKESFNDFWESSNEAFAEAGFKEWYSWAVRSQLKPIIKVAKMLKRHLEGLLSYFKYRITNAVSEGLNSKIQSIKSAARGFRSFENYRIRILFFCGKLEMGLKSAH